LQVRDFSNVVDVVVAACSAVVVAVVAVTMLAAVQAKISELVMEHVQFKEVSELHFIAI